LWDKSWWENGFIEFTQYGKIWLPLLTLAWATWSNTPFPRPQLQHASASMNISIKLVHGFCCWSPYHHLLITFQKNNLPVVNPQWKVIFKKIFKEKKKNNFFIWNAKFQEKHKRRTHQEFCNHHHEHCHLKSPALIKWQIRPST